MNAKKFSDALGEMDSRYVEEALSYHTRVRRVRYFPAAAAAAVLALLLMGAGVITAIYGGSIQSWFDHQWEIMTGQQMSSGQSAVIDHLSQEVGISRTAGGLTVTVDSATIGYDNFFLLLRVEGMPFARRYGYTFENILLEVDPDPIQESGGMRSCGFQYYGVDGDGAALFLVEHSYAGEMVRGRDTRPLDVALTLKNFGKRLRTEKLVAEGEWSFHFSLDRSQPIPVIRLPDTEVLVPDRETGNLSSVTVRRLELTSTGLAFQYNRPRGDLSLDEDVSAVLRSGEQIRAKSGSGVVMEDGVTLNCAYQWPIPFDTGEITCVQIGETQIPVPHE